MSSSSYDDGHRSPSNYASTSYVECDTILVCTPRNRRRPPKTNSEHPFHPSQPARAALSTPLNGHHHSAPRGKGKGRALDRRLASHPTSSTTFTSMTGGLVNVSVIRDQYCSFCAGTDDRNKQGQPEQMASCARCGRSGHPSCLNMQNSKLRAKVMTYDWCCIECKTCEVCAVKGEDVSDP